jgi:hypothetical protein
MSEILVQLQPATELGRMEYFRDKQIESQITFIESPVKRRMANVLNMGGGNAILMFDANRVLINVEFICPRRAWVMDAFEWLPPMPSKFADIRFVDVLQDDGTRQKPYKRKRKNSFAYQSYATDECDVTFITNASFDYVRILFDHDRIEGEWIGLSEQCAALVHQNSLRGFFVKLAGAPDKIYPARDEQL